jgi:hypothetical protein
MPSQRTRDGRALSQGPRQRADAELDPLVDESSNDGETFVHRRVVDVGRPPTNGALDLFAEDAPFAPQRIGRPSETRSLRAVSLGHESLDLGTVGNEARGLPARLLDGNEDAAKVRDVRPDVIGQLREPKRLRRRHDWLGSQPRDERIQSRLELTQQCLASFREALKS